MKKIVPFFFALYLLFSCSKSDFNETETEKEPPVGLPTLTTSATSEITQTSAISGGNISDDGGTDVTARGVCWSTSTRPTINDSKTSDGSGNGEFSSSITGLEAGTDYFLRAYTTNSEGTAYGNEVSFKTLEPEPIAKVFEGTVVLFTQQEVNDFGDEKYTEINGDLFIGTLGLIDLSEIIDLSPLSSLTKTERLTVRNTSNLESLDGLENIKTAKDLNIRNNLALKDADCFDSLETIENGFTIGNNDLLQTIKGFNSLNYSGSLIIIGNLGLQSITGFENLTETSQILIKSNPSLRKVENFNELLYIENQLNIEENDALEEIVGFSKTKVVGDPNVQSFDALGMRIIQNKLLTKISGFEGLTTARVIAITVNVSLEIVNGFNNLKSIKFLNVSSNPNFSKLNAFKSIEKLENLILLGNNGIQNLDNFESIQELGKLRISGYDRLENLDGLSKITSIANIEISSCDSLTDFCGLNKLVDLGNLPETYLVNDNAYNPTLEDIQLGNCSQ